MPELVEDQLRDLGTADFPRERHVVLWTEGTIEVTLRRLHELVGAASPGEY